MRITEETVERLVVKKTQSYLGIILIVLGIFFAFFALALSLAHKGQPSGPSRAPVGAVVFVFPVGGLIFLFLDWRQNRKTLIMDSAEQIAIVIGSKTYKIPYEQINRFCLGKTALYNATLIEFELKSGRRFSTGIDSHRGKDEDVEIIMRKLTEKLRQPQSFAQKPGK